MAETLLDTNTKELEPVTTISTESFAISGCYQYVLPLNDTKVVTQALGHNQKGVRFFWKPDIRTFIIDGRTALCTYSPDTEALKYYSFSIAPGTSYKHHREVPQQPPYIDSLAGYVGFYLTANCNAEGSEELTSMPIGEDKEFSKWCLYKNEPTKDGICLRPRDDVKSLPEDISKYVKVDGVCLKAWEYDSQSNTLNILPKIIIGGNGNEKVMPMFIKSLAWKTCTEEPINRLLPAPLLNVMNDIAGKKKRYACTPEVTTVKKGKLADDWVQEQSQITDIQDISLSDTKDDLVPLTILCVIFKASELWRLSEKKIRCLVPPSCCLTHPIANTLLCGPVIDEKMYTFAKCKDVVMAAVFNSTISHKEFQNPTQKTTKTLYSTVDEFWKSKTCQCINCCCTVNDMCKCSQLCLRNCSKLNCNYCDGSCCCTAECLCEKNVPTHSDLMKHIQEIETAHISEEDKQNVRDMMFECTSFKFCILCLCGLLAHCIEHYIAQYNSNPNDNESKSKLHIMKKVLKTCFAVSSDIPPHGIIYMKAMKASGYPTVLEEMATTLCETNKRVPNSAPHGKAYNGALMQMITYLCDMLVWDLANHWPSCKPVIGLTTYEHAINVLSKRVSGLIAHKSRKFQCNIPQYIMPLMEDISKTLTSFQDSKFTSKILQEKPLKGFISMVKKQNPNDIIALCMFPYLKQSSSTNILGLKDMMKWLTTGLFRTMSPKT